MVENRDLHIGFGEAQLQEIYQILNDGFGLSKTEIDGYLVKLYKKYNSKFDFQRFRDILVITYKYCKPFAEKTEEKLKRKVGSMFFNKLDLSQFYDQESVEMMRNRLNRLFYQTSHHNVNTYKILYCSVLTDGNLKREDAYSRYYINCRDFDEIYDSLKTTLSLNDAETVAIFEKCSSLIAKGYSYKFPHVFNKLERLAVYDSTGGYFVFRPEEIKDILKINPSLFVLSTDRIQEAFDYLLNKIEVKAQAEIERVMAQNPNMNFLTYKAILTRNWLKNNSSLLTINSSKMYKVEKYLKKDFNQLTSRAYEPQLSYLFRNPTYLALINQIPDGKVERNALKNIQLLENYVEKEKIAKYIKENPLVIGMDYIKFGLLFEQVVELDSQNPNEKYVDKFLEFGRTLFASNLDFEVAKIIEKLKNNQVMIEIDVDELSEAECLDKFVDLFFDGDHTLAREIEALIKDKQDRNARGEKVLRSDIRQFGKRIVELPTILKSDLSITKQRERVLKLAQEVESLKNRRFAIYGLDFGKDSLYLAETENSKRIESALNKLRDAYEQKKFKLGKKYTDIDQLYGKMMEYLDKKFDDKEAISELFDKEITMPFIDAMKTNFDAQEGAQESLFDGKSFYIKGFDRKLTKPLNDLNKALVGVTGSTGIDQLTFESRDKK